MADHTPTSWYVMERMELPYDAATSALGSIVPVSSIETATEGRLVVDTVRHARPGAVQGFVGRLRCGSMPWHTVNVEVDIEPWSPVESVVAVRPVTRPPRFGADRYFERSRTVLDALRSRLLDSSATSAERLPMVAMGAMGAMGAMEDLRKAS